MSDLEENDVRVVKILTIAAVIMTVGAMTISIADGYFKKRNRAS